MVEEERRDMSYPRRAYLIIKLLRLRAACIEEEERRDMSYPRRAVKQIQTYESEELFINTDKFSALIDYCQKLEDMQESHIDEISQLIHQRKLLRLALRGMMLLRIKPFKGDGTQDPLTWLEDFKLPDQLALTNRSQAR
ncbi:hypothetical protein F8M41_013603 [Gigaspora margarita]|uniref:Uncharacterized protein n=1 Tax=Gigaspora margarita TaxID=4874 RepID=A0A8H4A0A2_GIGMA|nr:hypothetical protein F8M41_013603 [Gigaspora margarita]